MKRLFPVAFSTYPTIISSISFAKVIITPPARVRKPLALCDGSCDFRDNPICTIPNPRRISPIALIRLNMNVDRLFITVSGSCAAYAHTADIVAISTTATYARNRYLTAFDTCSAFTFFLLITAFTSFNSFKDICLR